MLGIFRVMLSLQPFYIDHWGEAFHGKKKKKELKKEAGWFNLDFIQEAYISTAFRTSLINLNTLKSCCRNKQQTNVEQIIFRENSL